MNVILRIFLIILILALVIYMITLVPMIGHPWNSILICVAVLGAIFCLVQLYQKSG